MAVGPAAILVSSVPNNLTMPEFSATLLGLMGISSGTYIGFSFPRSNKDQYLATNVAG